MIFHQLFVERNKSNSQRRNKTHFFRISDNFNKMKKKTKIYYFGASVERLVGV